MASTTSDTSNACQHKANKNSTVARGLTYQSIAVCVGGCVAVRERGTHRERERHREKEREK